VLERVPQRTVVALHREGQRCSSVHVFELRIGSMAEEYADDFGLLG